MTDGGVVRAYTYQNTGLTHSRTLMPLVDAMLRESEQSLSDMDLLAVAAGPGSFTGLRIGVSALKGLAWAADKPCCGVSTLEAMAQNLRHMDGLIVCSMDARRNQVYNAVFAAEGGQLTRLTPDRAIALSQLAEELQGDPRPKLVVGDGAALCSGFLSEAGIPCRMAPAQLVMQNAVGVALAAEEMAARGETVSARDLVPVYLRLSQAERERLEQLIRSVKDTIGAEERNEIMSDEQKFEAFKRRTVTHNEEVYGAEIRTKYGDQEVDEANVAVMGLTQAQYQEWTDLGREIQERLEAAVQAGLSPEDQEGKEITALHRRWLTITGKQYDPARHRGIAELYVMDERFTAYYDKRVPGCARFLRDAVAHWVK